MMIRVQEVVRVTSRLANREEHHIRSMQMLFMNFLVPEVMMGRK